MLGPPSDSYYAEETAPQHHPVYNGHAVRNYWDIFRCFLGLFFVLAMVALGIR